MTPRGARSLVAGLITHGREAGTADAASARAAVSLFLSQRGYEVQEHSFAFNAGIYRALPAAGTMLVLVSLIEIPLIMRPGPAWSAAVVLLVLIALSTIVAIRFVLDDGAAGSERLDANLIASREGVPVRCWFVAHIDTKAQGHSMAGRLVALWVTVVALVGLAAVALLRLGGPLPAMAAFAAGALGTLAGVSLLGGRLRGQSPGARDNGSGLLAVLTAAELTADPGIGIIITSAEEFGLAGARALARDRRSLFENTEVVNVDTVDDEGTMFVVSHGPASPLADRVQEALSGLAPTRGRRLPLGIMVDGVPLAQVARGAVTIGRLSWGTLRLMHTPRDEAAGFALATAEALGERLALPI